MAQRPYQPPPSPQQPIVAASGTSKGLAIISLIAGILAILVSPVPFLGFLMGAAAVVIGIIALRKAQSKGMNLTGIIAGGIGALLSVMFTVGFLLPDEDCKDEAQTQRTAWPSAS